MLADAAGWILTVPVTTLNCIFSTEALTGLLPARTSRSPSLPCSIAVIVPAHDEEAGIGRTVAAMKSQLPPRTRLLVVADNCSDRTAAIARAHGAEAIERNEPGRRGKSYALDFARHHLQADPPDLVAVIDADCIADPGALEIMAAESTARQAAVQADNRLRPLGSSPLVQISNFAFFVKNSIRHAGVSRLGGPALLTGTGMMFPWSLFNQVELATGSLVEDLELGIALTNLGRKPLYCPSARVWSNPAPASATLSQRARWEGGFLSTARTRALPLLRSALRRLNWPMLCLGLHLLVPPLAMLVYLNLCVLVAGSVLVLTGSDRDFLYILLLFQIPVVAAIVGGWLKGGRAYLPLRAALAIPLYLAWKVPLYMRLLFGRSREWVRTRRDGAD